MAQLHDPDMPELAEGVCIPADPQPESVIAGAGAGAGPGAGVGAAAAGGASAQAVRVGIEAIKDGRKLALPPVPKAQRKRSKAGQKRTKKRAAARGRALEALHDLCDVLLLGLCAVKACSLANQALRVRTGLETWTACWCQHVCSFCRCSAIDAAVFSPLGRSTKVLAC